MTSYNPTDDPLSARAARCKTATLPRDAAQLDRRQARQQQLGDGAYYMENNGVPRKLNVTIEQNIVNGGTYAMWLSTDRR
jgi:hypothetical protein